MTNMLSVNLLVATVDNNIFYQQCGAYPIKNILQLVAISKMELHPNMTDLASCILMTDCKH